MKQILLSNEELDQLKLEVDYLLRKTLREIEELESRKDRKTDEYLYHARQYRDIFTSILKKFQEAKDVQ